MPNQLINSEWNSFSTKFTPDIRNFKNALKVDTSYVDPVVETYVKLF